MARHHHRHDDNTVRKMGDERTPSFNQDSIRTPLANVQQMRDPIRVARAVEARRFADALQRIEERRLSMARMQTEDLRHERQDLQRRTYLRSDGRPANVERDNIRQSPVRNQMPPQMRDVFSDSRSTLVCQRRRTRREVIFALQRAGKGGKRNRRARWTEKSEIVCRKVR